MILYFADIPIRTGIHKPLLKKHAGQDWATATIYIDEKPIECHLDQRLGVNLYFLMNDKWHFLRMSSQYSDKHQYSFNPINQTVKFKMKK